MIWQFLGIGIVFLVVIAPFIRLPERHEENGADLGGAGGTNWW